MLRATQSYRYTAAARKFLHNSSWDEHTLDNWLRAREIELQLNGAVPTAPRLKALLGILPTRQQNDFGTHKVLAQDLPKLGDIIQPGHHLTMLPLSPESRARPDGSPAMHAPPVPWTRKQWAGGKIHFAPQQLLVGSGFIQRKIRVVKKYAHSGLETPAESDVSEPLEYDTRELLPTVKVHHRIISLQWYPEKLDLVAEERETEFFTDRYDRSHIKTSILIPPQSGELSFAFNATVPLLSEFCAVSRETHRIHLDLAYANEEGYPNFVIPVSLQLITILDTVGANMPEGFSIQEISYEVVNPLFAEHEISVYRHWLRTPDKGTTAWQPRPRNPSKSQRQNLQKRRMLLWTADNNGVTGIVAKVFFRSPPKEVPDRPWNVHKDRGFLVYKREPEVIGLQTHSLEAKALELPDHVQDNDPERPTVPQMAPPPVETIVRPSSSSDIEWVKMEKERLLRRSVRFQLVETLIETFFGHVPDTFHVDRESR